MTVLSSACRPAPSFLERIYRGIQRENDPATKGGFIGTISFETARDIVIAHTRVERDKETGLLYRTVTSDEEIFHLCKGLTRSNGMGLAFWSCGRALLRAIKEKEVLQSLFKDKRVLGLCSGSGLAEVYITKHFGAEMVMASDKDVFSRALCHLNAELNELEVGDRFVVSNDENFSQTYNNGPGYEGRLFDTVIAADFWYGHGLMLASETQNVMSRETTERLWAAAANGADVLFADVIYPELCKKNEPDWAREVEWQRISFSKETMVSAQAMLFDKKAIALGLEPRHEFGLPTLPVQVHLWPARKATLPRLNERWWQPPQKTL